MQGGGEPHGKTLLHFHPEIETLRVNLQNLTPNSVLTEARHHNYFPGIELTTFYNQMLSHCAFVVSIINDRKIHDNL